MNKLIKERLLISIPLSIFFFGIILSTLQPAKLVKKPQNFNEVHTEVKKFFKEEVGFDVKTPTRPTLDWTIYPNVLAYCYQGQGNKFISFNYSFINEVGQGNMEFVFQVILHEYTHCEASVGHIEMYGHFMNDGGAMFLKEKQVRVQFINFVKYYRSFYNELFQEPSMEDSMYALTIERDDNGTLILIPTHVVVQ